MTADTDNVTPIRPLTKDEALAWLQANAPADVKSYRSLAQRWGWDKQTAWRAVQGWRDEGRLTVENGSGSLVLDVSPDVSSPVSPDVSPPSVSVVTPVPDYVSSNREVTPMGWFSSRETAQPYQYQPPPYQPYPPYPQPGYPPPPAPPAANDAAQPSAAAGTRRLRGDVTKHFAQASAGEKLWLLIAMGLSGWAAWVSVHGMVALFPAGGQTIVVGAAGMEALKIIGFMQLSAGRRAYSAFARFAATAVLLVIAVVNAAGVYGWLYASHAGPSAQRAAQWQIQQADQGAELEIAQGKIADAEDRIRTLNRLPKLTPGQRAELEDKTADREAARRALATIHASKHRLAAEQAADEASSAPLRAATLLFIDLGIVPPDTKVEVLERILFGMILISGDPAALIVLWAMGSRWRR